MAANDNIQPCFRAIFSKSDQIYALIEFGSKMSFGNGITTPKYEYLDHPADVQIHSWGDNLIDAFENCGLALYNYMTDLQTVAMTQSTVIEVEGTDLDNLLFQYLNELLYIFSTDDFLVCRKLNILELDEVAFKIKCECHGETFDLAKHPQGTEVKAITYAQMTIVNSLEDNDFQIFVIIDI